MVRVSNLGIVASGLEPRMHNLASIFALDIAAYAVMSNHYCIVLYIDKEKALSWPDTEVILR
ncbi:hypothetical protein GCM10027180_29870 [Microbulbifer echini]